MIRASCSHSRRGVTLGGMKVDYGRLQYPVAEFVYEGRDEHGALHLWQENGRWTCLPHSEPHPNDLKLPTKSP